MGTDTFVEDFKDELEFTPVEGQPNLFLIRPRSDQTELPKEEMTSANWDEFERNICELRVR